MKDVLAGSRLIPVKWIESTAQSDKKHQTNRKETEIKSVSDVKVNGTTVEKFHTQFKNCLTGLRRHLTVFYSER